MEPGSKRAALGEDLSSPERAGGRGSISQEDLDALHATISEEWQKACASTAATQQVLANTLAEQQRLISNFPAVVMGVVGPQLKKQDEAFGNRCASIEADLATIKLRLAESEKASTANTAAARLLASKVNVAEAITLQEHKAASAIDDFDRLPNPAHLKLKVGDRNGRVKIEEVEAKIAEIAADISMPADAFQVLGAKLGGVFTINCAKTGSISIGEIRAKNFMDYLYNHGDWKTTSIDDPSGKSLRCYFERDKNKRQSMAEGLTRKAFYILKTNYPALAPQFQSSVKDYKVFHNGQHLARIVVAGPSSAHLEWCKGSDAIGIDLQKVTAEWQQLGRMDDGVEWIRV